MTSMTAKRTMSLILAILFLFALPFIATPKASALMTETSPDGIDILDCSVEDAALKLEGSQLNVFSEDFVSDVALPDVTDDVVTYEATCCERMNVVRYTTEVWHIYYGFGGPCQSVCYFGYLYCTNCGELHSDNVCYLQTSGCESWHGASSASL